ncbi:MAG: undecaprenyl-diphosphate phosphatase [Oscillibacter sp.]|nr:undecaprenyl-diphosphate phosphatase [Oscillibacter sp.]
MSLLSSFLLGLIQGIAEFLPISSSGHLAIAQHLLNVQAAGEENLFFTVLLHLGTLAAVFVAYWHDIVDMVAEFFRAISDLIHRRSTVQTPPARRLVLMVIVGTLPLFLILPFQDFLETLTGSMTFIGCALIVTGLLLFFSDRVRRGHKTEKTSTLRDTLIVGAAQAIATCPGISRSGMTICTGTFLGFDRKYAVRFSFLLSIPAVLGATLLQAVDVVKGQVEIPPLSVCLVGILTAAVVGYLCIRLLRIIAERGKFGWFAYYCWAVGALTLILNAIR